MIQAYLDYLDTSPQNSVAFEARFARKDCTPCPFRALCTKAKQEPRIIGLLPREQHEVPQSAR
jgi:transposase